MNNSSVLLSISMLISGREEMRKSLDSLLYFKNAFPTEIILVDTGCSPEQRTLAEKYADKIIDFTWCNDFAAARNAGLREAHGEWFMYLDDDEWFEILKKSYTFLHRVSIGNTTAHPMWFATMRTLRAQCMRTAIRQGW